MILYPMYITNCMQASWMLTYNANRIFIIYTITLMNTRMLITLFKDIKMVVTTLNYFIHHDRLIQLKKNNECGIPNSDR